MADFAITTAISGAGMIAGVAAGEASEWAFWKASKAGDWASENVGLVESGHSYQGIRKRHQDALHNPRWLKRQKEWRDSDHKKAEAYDLLNPPPAPSVPHYSNSLPTHQNRLPSSAHLVAMPASRRRSTPRRKASRKRRPSKRIKRRVATNAKRVKRVSKKLALVAKIQKQNIAVLDIRSFDSFTVVSTAQDAPYSIGAEGGGPARADLDLDDLPVLAANTGTGALGKLDLSLANQTQHIYHGRNKYRIHLRNNYEAPCTVQCFVLTPKKNTGTLPTTIMSNNLTDMSNTASNFTAGIANPLLSHTDYPNFKKIWKVKKVYTRHLPSGSGFAFNHIEGGFAHDFSLRDEESEFYQRRYKSVVFMFRIMGDFGHDETSTFQRGFIKAECDGYITSQRKVYYDGGANLKNLKQSLYEQTLTTDGVVTSMHDPTVTGHGAT